MQVAGIYTTSQLRALGLTRRNISDKVRSGELSRICRGWYTDVTADPDLIRGIRLGGRVGCLSGCLKYGLWVPAHFGLHVVYGQGCDAQPSPGVILHAAEGAQASGPIWPLLDCLSHVLHRHSREDFLVVAESAMNLQLAHEADVRAILRHGPANRQTLDRHLAWAQSGSETRVRYFFQQSRVPVTAQALIPGVGRVDLLVGKRLIVECDSGEFHRTPAQQAADRRRDLRARELGYDVIRLSYEQIWPLWEATRGSLRTVIRQRRHLLEPRPLCA